MRTSDHLATNFRNKLCSLQTEKITFPRPIPHPELAQVSLLAGYELCEINCGRSKPIYNMGMKVAI